MKGFVLFVGLLLLFFSALIFFYDYYSFSIAEYKALNKFAYFSNLNTKKTILENNIKYVIDKAVRKAVFQTKSLDAEKIKPIVDEEVNAYLSKKGFSYAKTKLLIKENKNILEYSYIFESPTDNNILYISENSNFRGVFHI